MIEIANRLGERAFAWTHRSGLRVRVLSKPFCSRTHATLAVRFGSIDDRLEDERGGLELPQGLAHYLEHQMFESEDGDIAGRFAALGASSNAATSFTHTSYVFDSSTHVDECIRLLLELVRKPWFTDATVAKERAVIAREIRMYEDDPGSRQFQNLLRALYREHPVRSPIAGTEASIAGVDVDLLMRTHRAFYGPDRLALALVGDIDPRRVASCLDEALRDEPDAPQIAAYSFPVPDDAPVAAEEVSVELDVARTKWVLGIKDVGAPTQGIELLRREVATWMLLDALYSPSSVAHERWLEAGLVDDSFGFDYTADPSFGFVAFASELGNEESASGAPAIERAVFEVGRRAVETGIDEADLERVRRKHVGRFVASFDHVESLSSAFAEPAFLDLSPFQWQTALEEVTRSDVNARAREIFLEPKFARSFVVPVRGQR